MKRVFPMVMLVVGLIGLSATPLFANPTGPTLVVANGSIIGVVKGNFSSINSAGPLRLDFNATTYINQSTGIASTLSILVQTVTYGVPGGSLEVNATVTVLGRFAGNLHPSDLVLAVNATAVTDYPYEIDIESWGMFQTGTNVSYSPQQGVGILGTGSGTLTATLVNQNQGDSVYAFAYQNKFEIEEYYQYVHFVGFQATLGGLDTTAQVSALITIANSP